MAGRLLFFSPVLLFDPFVCICVCICSCWSIPGLKLVPARSPNGYIDHCSVPFSNQRTAVVASAAQEITHFNEEILIIFLMQGEEEITGRMGDQMQDLSTKQ